MKKWLLLFLWQIPRLLFAQADTMIDQAQENSNYGFWFDSNVERWQEFRPTKDTLSKIEISIGKGISPGDVIVTIKDSIGNIVRTQNILQNDAVSGWNSINFTPAVILIKEKLYKIYVKSSVPSVDVNNRYFWDGQTESNYLRGQSEPEVSSNGYWSNFDFTFRTYAPGVVLPDLIFSSFNIISFSTTAMNYSYTVKNIGTGIFYGDTIKNPYVVFQAMLGPDTIYQNAPKGAGGWIFTYRINPGQEFTFSNVEVGFNPPAYFTLYPYLLAKIDRDNTVSELNEHNNEVWIKLPIQSSNVLTSDNVLPDKYFLSQNYPNPFNPATQIQFSLVQHGFVTLKIFDILGKEVETLVNGENTAGNYTATWNAGHNPSGIYFYRLTTGSYTITKKLILQR